MSNFASSFVRFLNDGASAIWSFLSSSFVSAVLVVFVGSFVALRAFYIQKRHERMAEKYEKTFALLSFLSENITSKPVSILNQGEFRKKYLEMVNLLSTAKVYFGPEACGILSKFMVDIDRQTKERAGREVTDEHRKKADDLILNCYDELAKAAEKDLRPNLVEFAKHFVTVFING